MTDRAALQLTYWAARQQDDPVQLRELDGMAEFRQELQENYLAIVRGRPAGLGGLYQFTAEIISTFALSHVVRLLLDGVAFDLIKEGSKEFVLRPFLAAYKKFRERNAGHDGYLETLHLLFQDSILTIDNIGQDGLLSALEEILLTLSRDYGRMRLDSGETPYQIHVPVFRDPEQNPLSPFRSQLKVDEAIPNITLDDYFRFWGLWYDFAARGEVFDVRRRTRLPDEFLTRERYWQRWDERRAREKAEAARDR